MIERWWVALRHVRLQRVHYNNVSTTLRDVVIMRIKERAHDALINCTIPVPISLWVHEIKGLVIKERPYHMSELTHEINWKVVYASIDLWT